MPHDLSIALIAGFGGMLGWGFADFFAKKTIDEIGDILTLAWAGVFGTAVFLLAVAYERLAEGRSISVPHDPLTWAGFAFFGALQAAVYLFVYNGFGKGQVAVLNPIFASFSGIVAVISIGFLGEASSVLKVISLCVIFAGIILTSIDPATLSFRRISFTRVPGMAEVVAGTVLAAVWTLLWDTFVSGQDWLAYALYMFICMTVAVFVYAKAKGLPIRIGGRGVWAFVALIGACETLAYLAISLGYATTSLTSIVALISGAFSVPTIILSRLFLKERPNVLQSAGAILIIAGIIALALV